MNGVIAHAQGSPLSPGRAAHAGTSGSAAAMGSPRRHHHHNLHATSPPSLRILSLSAGAAAAAGGSPAASPSPSRRTYTVGEKRVGSSAGVGVGGSSPSLRIGRCSTAGATDGAALSYASQLQQTAAGTAAGRRGSGGYAASSPNTCRGGPSSCSSTIGVGGGAATNGTAMGRRGVGGVGGGGITSLAATYNSPSTITSSNAESPCETAEEASTTKGGADEGEQSSFTFSSPSPSRAPFTSCRLSDDPLAAKSANGASSSPSRGGGGGPQKGGATCGGPPSATAQRASVTRIKCGRGAGGEGNAAAAAAAAAATTSPASSSPQQQRLRNPQRSPPTAVGASGGGAEPTSGKGSSDASSPTRYSSLKLRPAPTAAMGDAAAQKNSASAGLSPVVSLPPSTSSQSLPTDTANIGPTHQAVAVPPTGGGLASLPLAPLPLVRSPVADAADYSTSSTGSGWGLQNSSGSSQPQPAPIPVPVLSRHRSGASLSAVHAAPQSPVRGSARGVANANTDGRSNGASPYGCELDDGIGDGVVEELRVSGGAGQTAATAPSSPPRQTQSNQDQTSPPSARQSFPPDVDSFATPPTAIRARDADDHHHPAPPPQQQPQKVASPAPSNVTATGVKSTDPVMSNGKTPATKTETVSAAVPSPKRPTALSAQQASLLDASFSSYDAPPSDASSDASLLGSADTPQTRHYRRLARRRKRRAAAEAKESAGRTVGIESSPPANNGTNATTVVAAGRSHAAPFADSSLSSSSSSSSDGDEYSEEEGASPSLVPQRGGGGGRGEGVASHAAAGVELHSSSEFVGGGRSPSQGGGLPLSLGVTNNPISLSPSPPSRATAAAANNGDGGGGGGGVLFVPQLDRDSSSIEGCGRSTSPPAKCPAEGSSSPSLPPPQQRGGGAPPAAAVGHEKKNENSQQQTAPLKAADATTGSAGGRSSSDSPLASLLPTEGSPSPSSTVAPSRPTPPRISLSLSGSEFEEEGAAPLTAVPNSSSIGGSSNANANAVPVDKSARATAEAMSVVADVGVEGRTSLSEATGTSPKRSERRRAPNSSGPSSRAASNVKKRRSGSGISNRSVSPASGGKGGGGARRSSSQRRRRCDSTTARTHSQPGRPTDDTITPEIQAAANLPTNDLPALPTQAQQRQQGARHPQPHPPLPQQQSRPRRAVATAAAAAASTAGGVGGIGRRGGRESPQPHRAGAAASASPAPTTSATAVSAPAAAAAGDHLMVARGSAISPTSGASAAKGTAGMQQQRSAPPSPAMSRQRGGGGGVSPAGRGVANGRGGGAAVVGNGARGGAGGVPTFSLAGSAAQMAAGAAATVTDRVAVNKWVAAAGLTECDLRRIRIYMLNTMMREAAEAAWAGDAETERIDGV